MEIINLHAKPSCQLFVGDISSSATEDDLYQLFRQYGQVCHIRLMKGKKNPYSPQVHLNYGFVRFDTVESATSAKNGLQGFLLCGRHLKIGWAARRDPNELRLLQHHDRVQSCSIHVTYKSVVHERYLTNRKITEENLRILFSFYGIVDDVSIKKSATNGSGYHSGYGFVHFAPTEKGICSALAAIQGLNGKIVDGFSFRCDISHDLEKKLGL